MHLRRTPENRKKIMHGNQIKNGPAPLERGGLEECTPEARKIYGL